MAGHVQVVLKEDVEGLGNSGALVRVRSGYARNFLLPRGLAAVATRGNIQRIEHEQRVAVSRAEKLRATAQAEASKFEGLVIELRQKAGEEGKLYGSVTANDVAEALKAKGLTVDKKKIQMPHDAIKQLGEHELAVKLAVGVVPTFKIQVVAE